MRKGDTNLSCSHCQRYGHDEENCWKLHPELKSEWFKDQQGKKKNEITIEDLGSDFEDETNITIVGVKGKVIVGNDSNIGSSCASISKDNVNSKDRLNECIVSYKSDYETN